MVSVMLRVAGVGEGDVVFDLGCNDGRVPITAAVAFGATGVGVEIDAGAAAKARRLAEEAGVSDRVTILEQNAVRPTMSPRMSSPGRSGRQARSRERTKGGPMSRPNPRGPARPPRAGPFAWGSE